MKYVVGLCGTHSTGKSTILNGVKDGNFPTNLAQLSRQAQASLGWDSLSKAEESATNMWQLQDAILTAMYDRDQAITDSKITTLVDRTPADVWAYTAMWCKRHGIEVYADPKARHFRAQCYVLSEQYAKFVIVPVSDAVVFESQSNRADLESRQFVDEEIRRFIYQSVGLDFYEIQSSDKHYRVSEVSAWMVLLSEKLHGKTTNT